jgi:hypothetical protein
VKIEEHHDKVIIPTERPEGALGSVVSASKLDEGPLKMARRKGIDTNQNADLLAKQ